MKCSCGSTDVTVLEDRAESICTACGAVLSESGMVEGLTFGESGGSIRMMGHVVSAATGRVLGSNESREQALNRGKNAIQRIADCLRLPTAAIEAASRIYLLAVQRNFTTGRKSMHVASACLYAVCRREKTPHMLMDFSDVLKTPIKNLAQIFLKLLRLLRLNVPHIDPSLFMDRFAYLMGFEEHTMSVANTAVRIIQAMTREWISTGRRPTGLCGAALLIAARYHGFKVNSKDIVHIVRISPPTLEKRLTEFKSTSAAQLNIEDFEKTDLLTLPILGLPPCLERARRAEKKLALLQQETLALEDGEADEESLPALPSISKPTVALDCDNDSFFREDVTAEEITEIAKDILKGVSSESQVSTTASESGTTSPSVSCDAEEDPLHALLLDVKDTIGHLHEFQESDDEAARSEALGLRRCEPLENETVESLSDVSDTEVDSVLLSQEDKEAKMLIWDDLTKSIMPEVCRRIRTKRRRQDDKNGTRRSTKRRETLASAETPADSVRMALQTTTNLSASVRLDSEALDALFSF